ncbi:MAG: 2-oxoacid:acceptor oxidoreductase family protein [Clostridiales bacterium]|nr:2-oxoacid:acceptor oxidoreductase family protein [Clostridiales bacterium]
MGTVKAGEVLVYASVKGANYGNSIPFFGFERQGAPVTSFVRLDDKPIRPKNQVYHPNCLIVMDETIQKAVNIFEGIRDNTIMVMNTNKSLNELDIPEEITKVGILDATSLSLEFIGRPIPNTIMLGAFVRATNWVDLKYVCERAGQLWGEKNMAAAEKGYELCEVHEVGENDGK